MTLYLFRLFAPEVQLRYVLSEGQYLAQRWEDEHTGVNLYHMGDGGRGFFAEVGYDDHLVELLVLRSFRSSVPLEDYGHGVRLPEL